MLPPDLRVLPCNRQTKAPLIAHGVHGASNDPALLEAWGAKWPDALWGVVCGDAFDVFDADPAGLAWAHQHLSELETYVQQTPRGLHFYFQPTPELKSRTACPVPGVDVRAKSSYVIDWKREGYRAVERPLRVLPDWLRELAMESRFPNAASMQKRAGGLSVTTGHELPRDLYFHVLQLIPLSDTVTRRDQRQVRGLLGVVVNATEGNRNNALNWAAFKIGSQLVASGIVTRANAETLLLIAAAGYVATDGVDAALATIRSGLDAGHRQPTAPIIGVGV
jgi:hypothetical protein